MYVIVVVASQGMKNPLQGYSKVSESGKEVFQYYIKVIPTKYTYPNGHSFETNQYSVTEHSMPILGNNGKLHTKHSLDSIRQRYCTKNTLSPHLTDFYIFHILAIIPYSRWFARIVRKL